MYFLTNYEQRLIHWVDEWRKRYIGERQFLLILAFFVGTGAAIATHILKLLIIQIEFLLTYQFDQTHAQWLYLIYPFIGILIAALFIKFVVRDNISHGITKILYSISRQQGHIASHNCWSSVIASAFTIGFGGSVGAESPIVLTGSAIGSTLGNTFRLDHKSLMVLIGCGASAAIAGIFKAPIAGIVFTLEILMIDLTMSALLPLLVASITATCFTYIFTGTESMFTFHLTHPFVLERIPSAILMGVACGLISLYFTRVMSKLEEHFARVKNLFAKVGIGGTILAILIYFIPPLYGEGYSTITLLINSKNDAQLDELFNNSLFYGHNEFLLLYLLLIVLLKVFATSATNGGGGCGGTFAPALFLGCVSGYFFASIWNVLHLFGVELPPSNFGLLGMAGLMSGAFHAPLTGMFLIAELTGGYELFIPLMIVSSVSYLTINIFEPHSIYAIRLARKGQLLTHNKDTSVLTLMSLEAVVSKDAPTLSPEMSLGDLVKTIAHCDEEVFAVTDANDVFLGVINVVDLRSVIFRSELYKRYHVSQLMEQPSANLSVDDTMQHVMDAFQNSKAAELPVLDEQGHFVGFISKVKLYSTYRQTIKTYSAE